MKLEDCLHNGMGGGGGGKNINLKEMHNLEAIC